MRLNLKLNLKQNLNLNLKLILLALLLTQSFDTYAWDEVTHAWMTVRIPELVSDPELAEILRENLDGFIYGSWYADMYQYSKGPRIEQLNPQHNFRHDQAFVPYLKQEEVQEQSNYNQLLALFLGSIAHIAEDLWYDNNLNPYQKQKSDRFKGDARHGAFVAKQYGYINTSVKRYLPYEDLYRIYTQAGLIIDTTGVFEQFKYMMEKWSVQQYKQLTSLKLLNFVAGNQLYSASPWTAANLYDAPGGMRNSTMVAAKMVESTWQRIRGEDVPPVIHGQYMWTIGSYSLLFSSPAAASSINEYKSFITDQQGDILEGSFVSHKNRPLVQCFKPGTPLEEGRQYTFVLEQKNPDPHSATNPKLEFDFIADYDHQMEANLAAPKPWYRCMGLTLFGFLPAIALSGIFFGLGGLIRFRWNAGHPDHQVPGGRLLLERAMQLISLAAFSLAVYIIASGGWIIVDAAL